MPVFVPRAGDKKKVRKLSVFDMFFVKKKFAKSYDFAGFSFSPGVKKSMQKLSVFVTFFGETKCSNPKRCAGFLPDFCRVSAGLLPK